MCLQRKKVHGVLRGAIRSVSKGLAVHCIATPVLPLQRVFPHTMCPKQDRKLFSGLCQGQAMRLSARRPAQRLASHWGRHIATPDALKTGHSKQTFTNFNVLPTQHDKEKENQRLRQGQATRLSARRPAQRPASHWGRHTASPDALKTRHSKQTFTHFNVLPTQYDREKKIGATAKARRRAFQCAARPSVRQGIEGGTLPPPMHQKRGIASKHSHILTFCQHNTTEKKRIGASTKARRRTFWRAARPSVRQGIGGGTLPPDALKTGHSKQKFTEFNVLATQYNREKENRRLRQRPSDAPFGTSPGPACGGKKKPSISFFSPIYILPFMVEGLPAPPPSSAPRALMGAQRCCSHAGAAC